MIVVAGEALIDVVIDTDGDEHEEVGGSPLNVAVALARLDVPTILITQTGTDDRGGRVVEHVAASGIELVVVPTASGRTATATAHLDSRGEATYTFAMEWNLPHQELPNCDALHVGSLGTVIEPGRDSILDLVDQAYGRGMFVSVDANLRPEFVDDPSQAWRDLEALAERANLVRLSTDDAALLHPGADPDDIARSFLSGERTELVVLTRGADGASAYVENGSVDVPAGTGEVIDTVGAGDAFTAAVLGILFESDAMSGYGAGVPDEEAALVRLLRGAAEVAAITCSRRGANPPLRSELPHEWPG